VWRTSTASTFNGSSSYGASAGNGIADGRRVPPWKFGVGAAAMSDDRGSL
jgi:hypothetical protein